MIGFFCCISRAVCYPDGHRAGHHRHGPHLNLTTIAEGFENADTLAVLRQFGCDEAQGYHFARPLPEAEFRRYLEAREQALG